MKKASKIIITILAVILVATLAFDVCLIAFKDDDKENLGLTANEQETEQEYYSDPLERQAREMIEEMTLYEKIGQMLLYYIPKEEPLEKMERWQFGGYIFFSRNFENSTPQQTMLEIAEYQTVAKIPAFMAVDEEGGAVNRISQYSQYRSEPFKSGRALYREGGWEAVISDSNDKADFLANLGFNTVLAPVADVPYSNSDFIYSRAFSTDENEVGEYIKNVVTAMNEKRFLSCVKHFPGYGNNVNTHTEISVDPRSWQSIEERDLIPFKAAVESGVPMIMVSHNIIEDFDSGIPASLSLKLHQYIRNEMNYDGIIVCDGLGMKGVTDYVDGDKGEAAVQAVLGGNDMLCATDVGVQLRAIAAAVENGRIDESQIDSSVERIIITKINYGIIERKYAQ
ncbi:MAG: glycoside hydrolase family 3 protein [Eubacterium sp.]